MSRTENRNLRVDEAAIVQRNALLAAIVRSASDAIIAIDAAGTIISWNFGAQLHFGWPESEMIGLPVARFVPPDRQREQEHALARIFAGEMVGSFRTMRTARSGQDIPVSVAMSPVMGDHERIVAASAIIRPRAAPRRAEPLSGQADLWSHLTPVPDQTVRRSILVVEDEALVGLGLAAMLENSGFNVIGPVGDLARAMDLLDTHDCALAILDVNLADGNTSEPLAGRLTREGIPFFVISGDSGMDDIAVFAGARKVNKPVGARKLVSIVHDLIG